MPDPAAASGQRRRADAERSVEAILDAALDELARDPDASMSAIARRAGVVRATVYVHFPTRESLIEAVTERAISEVVKLVDGAEPATGEPADALARVVRAGWRGLGRYHSLVAVNVRLPPHELRARHDPVLGLIEPLIVRGQRAGKFRRGVPPAWHLSMIMALMHAASEELRSRRVPESEIEPALVATVLGAVRR
jgi:TetR/AcrR family transcriptional regulator, mexCD-oprJ operon repressor